MTHHSSSSFSLTELMWGRNGFIVSGWVSKRLRKVTTPTFSMSRCSLDLWVGSRVGYCWKSGRLRFFDRNENLGGWISLIFPKILGVSIVFSNISIFQTDWIFYSPLGEGALFHTFQKNIYQFCMFPFMEHLLIPIFKNFQFI